MPLNVPITEEMVRGLAPDDATWTKAQEIATSNRFTGAGTSSDGTWLVADAHGSSKRPYSVSIDFIDANAPVLRSTSPCRQSPDKYSLGLMLKYAREPEAFVAREPSEELLAKREKKVAADERKKFGPGAPRREKKSAAEKLRHAQHEAMEGLEKLLVELVARGHWFDEGRVEKIERQVKALHDAQLHSPTFLLRRLLLLSKQKGIGEDERNLVAAEAIARLWSTVQHAYAYLDGKTVEGESANDTAFNLEEVLGHVLTVGELREKGHGRAKLDLLELAYERTDDDARQQRVEVSNLIDLETGEVLQATSFRPYKSVTPQPDQPSYMSAITLIDAAIAPGYINKTVRFDRGTEQVGRFDFEPLAKAYGFAKASFASVLAEFHAQLRSPLAPREAVFLLQPETIGKLGDRAVVLEDADGARIETADRRKDYSNTANLVRAAAMLGKDKPAVLVRLFIQPTTNTIVALPLAALTTKHHLRLGL